MTFEGRKLLDDGDPTVKLFYDEIRVRFLTNKYQNYPFPADCGYVIWKKCKDRLTISETVVKSRSDRVSDPIPLAVTALY